MRFIQNKWLFLSANLLGIILYTLVVGNNLLLSMINTLFYVGFFYLTCSLLMFTIKGKFFDGIVYGFRKVAASFSRPVFDEEENKPQPSERISKPVLTFFLFQGTFLTIIMVILLTIYYM
ncbi:DUF3899 domain-containing protein [Aquibacillus salsiterrae]|uniref:DUF3899 domain-containing protein n=1 Tax=Aquibacillus salsiterrae TaxID=2950439 RepID=A0A9X3WGV6_9BACI|nr:DUF3899 domain-containing protein [Aquibacillus salsiterrae]MDC3417209.1 DUF3899 domain-containing protein [Aquibacillus salsiterrae]